MRTAILIAAAWLALSSAAVAQSGVGGNGDAPHNKGSTGWTGAHPETGGVTLDKGAPGHPKSQTTGQSITVHDQDAAKSQPLMATGEDLKGPATRFPPSKTPE
ncbi:MAG: hypothetical protein JSR61_07320 [Proteobacteria bacterium]|nr:hypothetical protein [Pseudomonadota bacterium]